ncbi:tRNA (adenine(58)-N(1))-methyltransferase, mitochondrial-like [Patiria miniata]|uniref:tRNA (adenine(58)-N(1))-methyltransferase n=1 Tax=Patiria miniata TaxID=46514 RepID=A0A914BHS3_PATMI|nr:tRNA (adenine(58)-N(1))-methyltransferase, mitochondrial-like [Patiria miniata]
MDYACMMHACNKTIIMMMETPFLVQHSLLRHDCQKVIQRFFRKSLEQWPVMTGRQPCGVSRPVLLAVRTTCTSERADISTGTLPQIGWHFNRAHVLQRHRDVLKHLCLCVPNSNTFKFCNHPYSIKTVLNKCSSWGSCFQSRNFTETKSDGNESADGETRSKEGMSYLEARRRGLHAGRRSLSPTERLDQMMGVETSNGQLDSKTTTQSKSEFQSKDQEKSGGNNAFDRAESDASVRDVDRGSEGINKPGRFQDNPPMVDGEMVLAVRENFKRHEYLYRMFPLNANKDFSSKFGTISHADLVGHPAGKTFTTDLGIDVLIRRPSLEEFVLYMKRIPVISYPKDCCTMLMMIDASQGDVILEAGAGSGAMTLFLSRAVGPGGCVHSFEAKPEHLKRAAKNVKQWASSWNICHPWQPWPENVSFHSGTLQSCHKDLDPALLVDGAVIDMERPHEAMPVLAARLKSGKAAALYVANITQIVEAAEFLRVHSLPLTIEKTLEVTHKVWLVHQARRHSGISLAETTLHTDMDYQSDQSASDEFEDPSSSYIKDHIPKYIARPHNEQPRHSAFLVKVRKIESAAPTYKL